MTESFDQIIPKIYGPAGEPAESDYSTEVDSLMERREHPRRPFPVVQRIAARSGPERPHASEFFSVRFRDLSVSGFSFLLRVRPTFKSLVVALTNSQEEAVYMAAEVRHATEVVVSRCGQVTPVSPRSASEGDADSTDEAGTRMVLVGCTFTEHLGTGAPSSLW